MPNFMPVDHDPFASASTNTGSSYTPVEHDPFSVEDLDPAHKQARAYLDAHPEYKNKGMFDYAQRAAQGASLGWADNAVAGAAALRDYVKHGGNKSLGDYYSLEQAMQDEQLKDARKNTGMTGSALELAGSLLPISRIGKIAQGVTTPLKADVLTGAATGGIEAKGNGEDALLGTVVGGAGGAAANKLVGGIASLAGIRNKQPTLPELNDIKAAADTARQNFANSGVQYTPQGMQDLGRKLDDVLQTERYAKAPENFPALKGSGFDKLLNRVTNGNASIGPRPARDPQDLLDIHQLLNDVAVNNPGTKDSRVAGLLKQEIDDFMGNAANTGNPLKTQVSQGSSAQAFKDLKDSNINYTKYYKEKLLQNQLDEAALRAARTGSGGNIENTIRQNVDKLRNERKDWTPDELAAIERVVAGAPGQNLTRLVGKLSPEGNGLGAMLHLMAAPVAGGITVPAAGLGIAARHLSQWQTKRAADQLSRIIRAGGNKSNAFAGDNATQKMIKANQRKIVEGLLGTGAALY